MKLVRGKLRLATLAGTILIVAALIAGSMSPVVARSRAANRWFHVPGAARSVRAEPSIPRGLSQAIVLHELFTDAFTFVDVGEPGASRGDYGVFQDPIADPRTGDVIGTIDVQCIEAYTSQCRGSIFLNGRGQIVFDGVTPADVDPDVFAVTGGTGEFTGLGGTVRVSFPSDTYARVRVLLVP